MSIRIHWTPPTAAVTTYDVTRSDSATGTFVYLGTVQAEPRDETNFDVSTGRYFYDDPDGSAVSYYRVQGFGETAYVVADSGVFQPAVINQVDLGSMKRLDHNYGAVDAYRFTAPGGAGIPQATIRIWRKADYDAGRTDLALAVTETGNDGRWVTGVFLPIGQTYVVQFFKSAGYGPNIAEVTL